MSLVLEIEYLAGVCFAAIGPDSDVPDWPPQPDRVFSALVAAWAAGGADAVEAGALEWLEALPPPAILASDALPRTAPIVFVPPNDPRSDKLKHAAGVLPSLRGRQPRRFPAARPADPVVRLAWDDAAPTAPVLAALQRLARDTAYVGHSASLTRCRFVLGGAHDRQDREGRAHRPARRVYPGRLAELRRVHAARRRPAPGDPVSASPEPPAVRRGPFAGRWLILEHVGGDMPDVRAAALVGKAIRDALLSGYRQAGHEHAIPEWVSGHAADGTPTRAPHLAIVPLPFAGFAYADGHVVGFALVPPGDGSLLDDVAFRAALRAIAPIDPARRRRVMRIWLQAGTARLAIELAPTIEPGRRSLDPAFYTRAASAFATVTPIVLDRHLKAAGAGRDAEIAALIAAACGNAGLPAPAAVVADKHAAIEGMPSAYPSGGAPAWTRWRLPAPLASRQLTHAVIRFGEPVQGPLLLGAGRFLGLGLCRPLDGAGR